MRKIAILAGGLLGAAVLAGAILVHGALQVPDHCCTLVIAYGDGANATVLDEEDLGLFHPAVAQGIRDVVDQGQVYVSLDEVSHAREWGILQGMAHEQGTSPGLVSYGGVVLALSSSSL